MPIYVYECECGNKYEALKKMKDRYNEICPKCGKKCNLVISFNGGIHMASKYKFFADNGELISDEGRTDRNPRPVGTGSYERRL